jgi:hypothetical protein
MQWYYLTPDEMQLSSRLAQIDTDNYVPESWGAEERLETPIERYWVRVYGWRGEIAFRRLHNLPLPSHSRFATDFADLKLPWELKTQPKFYIRPSQYKNRNTIVIFMSYQQGFKSVDACTMPFYREVGWSTVGRFFDLGRLTDFNQPGPKVLQLYENELESPSTLVWDSLKT